MKIFLCTVLILSLIFITVGCNGGKTTVSEISSSVNLSSEVGSEISSSSVQSETSSKAEKLDKLTALGGKDPDLYKDSIFNEGNNARIAALMKKAEQGGTYTIGAIGGSITQGAGASEETNRYVFHVLQWWRDNFPKATFKLVNAGIGSSNAEMACYRMDTDLLYAEPDFVMVDFSVNTYLNNDQYNTYQTVLYKILNSKNSPGVIAIHFTSTKLAEYNKGNYVKGAEYPNDEIARALKKYDVPSMNYHAYVWKLIGEGVVKWTNVGADYIHPSNNGHKMAGAMINAYLDKVKANLKNESTAIPALPKLDTEKYLNLGYVINTVEGVTKSGFAKEANNTLQTRGWSYDGVNKDAYLTVPLPKNKGVTLFMWFGDTEGKITLKGANGKTETQEIKIKNNHVLMNYGEMGDSVTITAELTKGTMKILGIGINP